MLSSYETERQRPSIETLEKILTGLGATLTDLNDALVEVNVRTAQRRAQATIAAKARPGTAPAPPAPEKPSPNLRALPTHQQEAMRQMMAGFQAMMQTMAKSTAPPPEPPKLIRSRKTRR